ncbi:MAG TPA: hypothetical protein VF587_18815 [Solirubrobacteraceae bacterium]|jgi:hypothetical protein
MDPASAKRIAELEHLLEMERGRREAIEAGIDRLSERCHTLARENALLRERLGDDARVVETV